MRDEWVLKYGMLPVGARVLCAVSGGADSMCLLHWLNEEREARSLELFAAHFEHGLRGEESLRDADFVREACEKLGIPLTVGSGDVAAYAGREHLGLEEAARNLRYRFLEETADRLHCDRIATAHNADDNAETVLMNLCRGSGTRGLSGIPPVRGRLIRPLLQTGREEIEAYLAERGIAHVEDSSNSSGAFTRNRIRQQVLPLLKQENPSLLEAVSRMTELLREDERCLNDLADAFLREHFDGSSLPTRELLQLDPAIASRVLRRLCGQGLSAERCRALLRFAENPEPGTLEIPGKKIRREHRRLWFP